MGRRAAKATHLALFAVGVLLYFVFVLPRWWVLIGDIPGTLATAGRIAAGFPIALAALPVLTLLRQALGRKAETPELALRLRAWSAVLHLAAGALVLLAAIAEIWLGLGAAGPYLFGVYGAAAAIAILAVLALYLSFVAEKPPATPKPPKTDQSNLKKSGLNLKKSGPEKKPRGKKRAAPATVPVPAGQPAQDQTAQGQTPEPPATEAAPDQTAPDQTAPDQTAGAEFATVGAAEPAEASQPDTGGLRNQRPSGKVLRRLRR